MYLFLVDAVSTRVCFKIKLRNNRSIDTPLTSNASIDCMIVIVSSSAECCASNYHYRYHYLIIYYRNHYFEHYTYCDLRMSSLR